MPEFTYTGYNKKGTKLQEKIIARSEGEAQAKLRMRGIKVTSMSNRGAAKSLNKKGNASITDMINGLISSGKNAESTKISIEDLMIFTKQMSTLIDAGIAIVNSLSMLEVQTKSQSFKNLISHVREMVEGGKDLATAFEKYPQAFDQTYVALVKAGAASGQLDVMMKKISIYVGKSNTLRKQLKSALSYPAGILGLSGLMVVGMLKYVVPMFAKNYKEAGKPLPELTQMVIDMSDAFSNNWYFILAVIIGMGIAFGRWKNTPSGRRQFDAMTLKMPLLGGVISKIAIAKFTSTLATLVSSGISLPEALKICARAAGNKVIEEEIIKIENAVSKGKTLAESMEKTPVFPNMVAGMVHVGETTGRLDSMLEKIAAIYEEDVENSLAAALKMVEPLMFVFVGAIVGFFLIAMYLPIFDMASTM